MKTPLHLIGEMRAPKVLLIKKTNVPIRILLSIPILFFCFMFAANAQEYPVQRTPVAKAVSSENREEIIPLKIGDKIPDELWEMYFPVISSASENEQYLSLGDFKDKLIILDFWATWCGTCLSSFESLEAIHQKFNDDIKVLLVNPFEDEAQIAKRVSHLNKQLPKITRITNGKELKSYFPFKGIPHFIWIGEDRTVKAITGSNNVSEKNIASYLENKSISLPVKQGLDNFDPNVPMWIEGNGRHVDNLLAYSFMMKYIQGIPRGSKIIRAQNNKITDVKSGNMSILDFHKLLANHLSSLNNPYSKMNRIIFETDRLNQLIPPSNKEDIDNWWLENAFYYELKIPKESTSQASIVMKHDIENYFTFSSIVEERMVNCLSLRKVNEKVELKSDGKKPFVEYKSDRIKIDNYPMSILASVIEKRLEVLNLPVIDKTEINSTIDIEFLAETNDLQTLNAGLSRFGLELIQEVHKLPMLVIKDKEVSDEKL